MLNFLVGQIFLHTKHADTSNGLINKIIRHIKLSGILNVLEDAKYWNTKFTYISNDLVEKIVRFFK